MSVHVSCCLLGGQLKLAAVLCSRPLMLRLTDLKGPISWACSRFLPVNGQFFLVRLLVSGGQQLGRCFHPVPMVSGHLLSVSDELNAVSDRGGGEEAKESERRQMNE